MVTRYTNPNLYRLSKMKAKDLHLTDEQILDIYFKLSDLEDREQEFDIELDTLCEVIKAGKVYVKDAYNIDAGEIYDNLNTHVPLEMSFSRCIGNDADSCIVEAGYANCWVLPFQYDIDHDDCTWNYYAVKLSDYGKTWALTKEDLDECALKESL